MICNREKSPAAYQSLKDELSDQFPFGHFVALDDSKVVADGASFDELSKVIAEANKDRPDVFVVQVGVEYPDEVFIII